MENKLWKKIPTDVFINNIIPYTYQKQHDDLLNDIRNFTFVYRIIKNYYFFDLNEYCLLVDLVSFCTNHLCNDSNINRSKMSFINFLERNIIFKKMPLDKKFEYIKLKFYFNLHSKTEMKIKFLFGLLTPFERARFINEYIIIYE
uniref:Uncharacterized protein n=1 Tax=viral metagenome TaxID=1070528 RepID=A0A6C0DA91_9ZZZZ